MMSHSRILNKAGESEAARRGSSTRLKVLWLHGALQRVLNHFKALVFAFAEYLLIRPRPPVRKCDSTHWTVLLGNNICQRLPCVVSLLKCWADGQHVPSIASLSTYFKISICVKKIKIKNVGFFLLWCLLIYLPGVIWHFACTLIIKNTLISLDIYTFFFLQFFNAKYVCRREKCKNKKAFFSSLRY